MSTVLYTSLRPTVVAGLDSACAPDTGVPVEMPYVGFLAPESSLVAGGDSLTGAPTDPIMASQLLTDSRHPTACQRGPNLTESRDFPSNDSIEELTNRAVDELSRIDDLEGLEQWRPRVPQCPQRFLKVPPPDNI